MTYQNMTLHIEFLSLLLQTGEIKSISVNEYLLIFSRFNASTIYSLSRNKVKCEIGCFYSSVKKIKDVFRTRLRIYNKLFGKKFNAWQQFNYFCENRYHRFRAIKKNTLNLRKSKRKQFNQKVLVIDLNGKNFKNCWT